MSVAWLRARFRSMLTRPITEPRLRPSSHAWSSRSLTVRRRRGGLVIVLQVVEEILNV
jgi:hypothetical protein